MPILIDIGFNDIITPEPQEILYPTLLGMANPPCGAILLWGYTNDDVDLSYLLGMEATSSSLFFKAGTYGISLFQIRVLVNLTLFLIIVEPVSWQHTLQLLVYCDPLRSDEERGR